MKKEYRIYTIPIRNLTDYTKVSDDEFGRFVRDAIRATLEKLYSNYFENVFVIIDMEDLTTSSTVSYTINVSGYQNGVQYILSKVISESNKEIINYDEIIYDLRKQLRRTS